MISPLPSQTIAVMCIFYMHDKFPSDSFQLIAFLEANSLRDEGLLRIPGSQQRIKVGRVFLRLNVVCAVKAL